MTHCVVITGIHPMMNVAECETRESAEACAHYLGDMFPHLRAGGFIDVMTRDQVAAFTATPVGGFVKDSVQAYITTGNGYARPVVGTVNLGGEV